MRLPVVPEFIGGHRLVVRTVDEREASDALHAQPAKSHRDSLYSFSQQVNALSELDTLLSGARSSLSGRKMIHYSTLFETAGVLNNAAFNLENALLTNDFENWADHSGVDPVNIPKQFERGLVPEVPLDRQPAHSGQDGVEVRLPCGF
jgi:hypothetical protein